MNHRQQVIVRQQQLAAQIDPTLFLHRTERLLQPKYRRLASCTVVLWCHLRTVFTPMPWAGSRPVPLACSEQSARQFLGRGLPRYQKRQECRSAQEYGFLCLSSQTFGIRRLVSKAAWVEMHPQKVKSYSLGGFCLVTSVGNSLSRPPSIGFGLLGSKGSIGSAGYCGCCDGNGLAGCSGELCGGPPVRGSESRCFGPDGARLCCSAMTFGSGASCSGALSLVQCSDWLDAEC